MTEPSSIDPEALDRLREWGGEKLLSQMLRLFLDNSLVRMEQIREGAGPEGLERAEQGAHSLKSSAANVGARDVRALAAEIEERAGEGELEAVQGLLPRLETAYATARAELEAIQKGIPQ